MDELRVFLETKDGDGALGYVAPLLREGMSEVDAWKSTQYTYRWDVDTLVVVWESSPLRDDIQLWQYDPERKVWRFEDDAILAQLMWDDDAVCVDCLEELEYDSDELHTHCNEDECAFVSDNWDDVSGPFACEMESDAAWNAHRVWKEAHPEATCTLRAEYLTPDGDVLCRAHAEEEYGPFLTLRSNDDGARYKLLRQYFGFRLENPDEDADRLPYLDVLYDLARLEAYRSTLEEADRVRTRRDELVAKLRDKVSQTTVATHAGVSQQRVAQIQAAAEEAHRVWRLEFEARVKAEEEKTNEQHAEFVPPHIAIRNERGGGPTLPS